MPGEGLTHGPPAAKNAGGRYHRCSRSTGIPRATVFTFIARSPRCPGLIATVLRPTREHRREVSASVGAPGPHAFTSASCRSSACVNTLRHLAAIAPRLACRDDRAQRPFAVRRDFGNKAHLRIFVKRFFWLDWHFVISGQAEAAVTGIIALGERRHAGLVRPHLAPLAGRGRIASPDAIRVRGYRSLHKHFRRVCPSPQPSQRERSSSRPREERGEGAHRPRGASPSRTSGACAQCWHHQ